MDNFASFSFDSLNSIDAGPATFDMDGIVSPDSHSLEGNLPTAVDILNELDKELEAEFLLSWDFCEFQATLTIRSIVLYEHFKEIHKIHT